MSFGYRERLATSRVALSGHPVLPEFLKISPKISVLPLIHGSGDFAVEVRRVMLGQTFDCLAVPLPPSFQSSVEEGISRLPEISVVVQQAVSPPPFSSTEWKPESERDAAEEEHFDDDIDFDFDPEASYVPIDPCQGVIAGLRIALEERIPRAFIDLETDVFEPVSAILPDPYALKVVRVEQFAAAVLPSIRPLPEGQPRDRVAHMAARLRELEEHYSSILLLSSIVEWPWIRDAYLSQTPAVAVNDEVEAVEAYAVSEKTLTFLLGELPFVTAQYELARRELDDDENLSVDGVKSLLLTARDRYKFELKSRARRITPKMLSLMFHYIRNLCLIERRLTPDLYTLITAARQIAGDQYAVFVAQVAREYLPDAERPMAPLPKLEMGIQQAQLPNGDIFEMASRLPGHPQIWRSCQLKPLPPKIQQDSWRNSWNPFSQCSWPPEDVAIEKFRTHIRDTALAMLGTDLARTEKFTTSLKDGLDMRETLRNWHTGELFVKILPPTRGRLDCVIMLFDSPADPRDYPCRMTWHAEHHDESTLALFATDFSKEMVGPGIGLATYGGAMFLFPPRPIPEIWHDPRLNFADTLEERLLAAACQHSRERHIAILSSLPPGIAWKRIAKRFGKKLVHVPLSRFSQETIQQLRMFHVLNGREVRSFAAHFIRKA